VKKGEVRGLTAGGRQNTHKTKGIRRNTVKTFKNAKIVSPNRTLERVNPREKARKRERNDDAWTAPVKRPA